MKKLITIAVCLLAFSSCTKKGSTTGTGSTATNSTFNITLNGHSYNATCPKGGAVGYPSIQATTGTNTDINTGLQVFRSIITVNKANEIFFSVSGKKSDLSTSVGTYQALYVATPIIIDNGDGGKGYGVDSTSTVTISVSNSTEIKGTFNLTLLYNGSSYPATGDFDFKK